MLYSYLFSKKEALNNKSSSEALYLLYMTIHLFDLIYILKKMIATYKFIIEFIITYVINKFTHTYIYYIYFKKK